MKPSSPRLSTSQGQFPFTLTNQHSIQKQQSQMHATPARESSILFCVPSVAFERIIKESSRMISFKSWVNLKGVKHARSWKHTHTQIKRRTNDLKPKSPKLGTSQDRNSHAFKITMFEMKVYIGPPNFVVSRMVISNACDPPMTPPFKRALEWLVPVFRSAT